MSTYLSPVFGGVIQDGLIKREELLLFLSTFDVDSQICISLAGDKRIISFIGILYYYLCEKAFPSPQEGPISQLQLLILNFLIKAASLNPDMQSIVSSGAPTDKLIAVFFQKNITNDRILDPQPSHLLICLQYLSIVSQSSKFELNSEKTYHLLFTSLISVLKIPSLTFLSLSIIGGLSMNSTEAKSFIVSLSSFLALKKEICSYLTSRDSRIVLGSLYCLCSLFLDDMVETDVINEIVFSSLNSSNVIVTSAALSMLELSSSIQPIGEKLQKEIINTIYHSSGMKAYLLLRFVVNNLFQKWSLFIDLFSDTSYVTVFLNYFVESKEIFIIIACAQVLSQVLSSICIKETNQCIFSVLSALMSSIISTQVHKNYEKSESYVIVMRSLLKSDVMKEQIKNVISQNEDAVFSTFKGLIESNNPLLSCYLFLIIFLCSDDKNDWILHLRSQVIDSQFSVLVYHVMKNSQNRSVLSDMLILISIITQGVPKTMKTYDEALSNVLLDGVISLNWKDQKDLEERTLNERKNVENLVSKIQALEVERDFNHSELQNIREENEHSKSENDFAQQKIEEISKQLSSSREKITKKSLKMKELIEELKNTSDALQNEANRNSESIILIENFRKKIMKQKETITNLKKRIEDYQEEESKNQQMRQDLIESKQSISRIEKEKLDLKTMIGNECKKREKCEILLSESQNRISSLLLEIQKRETQNDSISSSISKIKAERKAQHETEHKLMQELSKHKMEISLMQQELANCKQDISELTTRNSSLSEKLSVALKQKREMLTMYKLIYKITDGNASIGSIKQLDGFNSMKSSLITE